MPGVNLNPREIKKDLDERIEKNYDDYSNLDAEVKKEIRDHIDKNDLWLTEEQIKKNKYADSVCSICGQNGCDHRVSYQGRSQKYHKKCFKMFVKKVIAYSVKKCRV